MACVVENCCQAEPGAYYLFVVPVMTGSTCHSFSMEIHTLIRADFRLVSLLRSMPLDPVSQGLAAALHLLPQKAKLAALRDVGSAALRCSGSRRTDQSLMQRTDERLLCVVMSGGAVAGICRCGDQPDCLFVPSLPSRE